MTENENINYVEIDFPRVIEQKRMIIEELVNQRKINNRKNLRLVAGDLLDPDVIDTAATIFQHEPITIVNEGLMRYQWFDKKAVLSRNNLRLLKKFSGTWITPDITLPEERFQREDVIRIFGSRFRWTQNSASLQKYGGTKIGNAAEV
jgi:hypothetical protein